MVFIIGSYVRKVVFSVMETGCISYHIIFILGIGKKHTICDSNLMANTDVCLSIVYILFRRHDNPKWGKLPPAFGRLLALNRGSN